MTQRMYIGGPISGMAWGNRALFTHAQSIAEKSGWEATTPFDLVPDPPAITDEERSSDTYWRRIMVENMSAMLEWNPDGMILLPHWRESRGTRIELEWFLALDKAVWLFLPQSWSFVELKTGSTRGVVPATEQLAERVVMTYAPSPALSTFEVKGSMTSRLSKRTLEMLYGEDQGDNKS